MNIFQNGQSVGGKQTNVGSVTITNSSGGATINGKTYPAGDISINNGKVFVNGVEQDGDLSNSPTINIIIDGDVELVETGNANVTAVNCGSIKTGNGNVNCSGNVSGDVTTRLGNVKCGAIGGDVTTKLGNISHR